MKQSVNDYISAVLRFISERFVSTSPEPAADPDFERLALSLFAFQFDHIEAYRCLCQARAVSRANVRHWREIPAVPTAAFKEFALTSLPASERTRVFHSSGTTQSVPGRHFHDEESIRLYERSLWLWFKRHVLGGVTPHFGLLALTPTVTAAPHSSLAHMLETVQKNFGWSAVDFCGTLDGHSGWQLDPENCLRALQSSIDRNRPLVILGTAFTFVHLIDLLDARRLRMKMPPGSRVMETGGYKGRSRTIPKSELHRLINDRLAIPVSHIVCEYGMSEISSQAYDHAIGEENAIPGRSFYFPPWARARLVSPETGLETAIGEIGLIQVFDLANVRSVMAIQTDDLGIRRADGFDLVGRAEHAEPRGCSLMAV